MIKQLIRTNPALTSNYKFIVTSDDKMYLESYDANYTLSNIKYKHFLVPTNSWLSERVSAFYKGLSKDLAFEIASINENNTYENKYINQYKDIYWAGCKNIEDKFYTENKEYIAPLLTDGNELPSYFLIYRINSNPIQSTLTDYTNFYDRKVKNMVLINSVDMTVNTNFGKFLKRNILDNNNFPKDSITIDVKKNEFSKWNGINYTDGGFISSALFVDEIFNADTIHSDTESYLTNGFRNTGVICSNILNFKFLFNDYQIKLNNSNKIEKIDFNLNEYMGFYSKERIKIMSYSPYITQEFNKNYYIVNNVFRIGPLETDISLNPLNVSWPSSKVFIKIDENFKEVVFDNNEYKIIDNVFNNLKVSDIYFDDPVTIQVVNNDGDLKYFLSTPGYSFPFRYEGIDSDFLTIEINGKMYSCKPNIINNDNNLIINGYYIYADDYLYSDATKTNIINLNKELNFNGNLLNNKPIEFVLYYHNMVEIHDLDFNFINTDYSKYEYELKDNIINTNQPKLQNESNINGKYTLNIDNKLINVNDLTYDFINKFTSYNNGTFEGVSDISAITSSSGDVVLSVDTSSVNALTGSNSLKLTTTSAGNLTYDIHIPFNLQSNKKYKISLNVKVPAIERDDYPTIFTLLHYGFTDGIIIDNSNSLLVLDGTINKYYNISTIFQTNTIITGGINLNIYTSLGGVTDIYYIDNINIQLLDPISSIKESDIPYSSEYGVGKDLFLNNNLKTLWSENPWMSKWGAVGSLGHSDYTYKFNVSSKISGYNNLEASTKVSTPDRKYCNLDWFYIIGEPRLETNNIFSVTSPNRYILQNYVYHSLHVSPLNVDYIQRNNDDIFWINQYFNIDNHLNAKEYFNSFFSSDYKYNTQDKKTLNKYSTFRNSDGENPPYTIFKGLKYNLWLLKNNKLYIDNTLNNLKFSIVLTKRPTAIKDLFGKCGGTLSVSRKSNSAVLSVWFYCPFNSLTSIESVYRENLYKGTVIYNTTDLIEQVIDAYCYDLNYATNTLIHDNIKISNLTPSHLTLYNIHQYISGNLVGFDYPMEYVSDDANSYYLTVQSPDEFIIDNNSYIINESDKDINIINKISNNNILKSNNTDIISTPYYNQSKIYDFVKINRTYDELYDLNTSSKIERFSCGYMPITTKLSIYTDRQLRYTDLQYNNTNGYLSITDISSDNKTGYLTLVLTGNKIKNIKENNTIYLDAISNNTYNNNTININMPLKPIWCKNNMYSVISTYFDKVLNKTFIKLKLVNIEKVNYTINNEDEIKISGKPITTPLIDLLETYIIDSNDKILNTYFRLNTIDAFSHTIENSSRVFAGDLMNTYNFICTVINNSNNTIFWCTRPELFKSINTNAYIEGIKTFGQVKILCNKITDNFFPKSIQLNIEPNLPIINEIKNDYIDFNIFSNSFEIGFYKNSINNNYIE